MGECGMLMEIAVGSGIDRSESLIIVTGCIWLPSREGEGGVS